MAAVVVVVVVSLSAHFALRMAKHEKIALTSAAAVKVMAFSTAVAVGVVAVNTEKIGSSEIPLGKSAKFYPWRFLPAAAAAAAPLLLVEEKHHSKNSTAVICIPSSVSSFCSPTKNCDIWGVAL